MNKDSYKLCVYFSELVSILQPPSHGNVNSLTIHFEYSTICIFAGFCQIYFVTEKCNDIN